MSIRNSGSVNLRSLIELNRQLVLVSLDGLSYRADVLLSIHEYGSASLRPITLNSQLVLVDFLRVLFLDTVVSFG